MRIMLYDSYYHILSILVTVALLIAFNNKIHCISATIRHNFKKQNSKSQVSTNKVPLTSRSYDQDERVIFKAELKEGDPVKLLEYMVQIIPNARKTQAKKWLQTQSVSINGVTQSHFDFQLQKYDTISVHSGKQRKLGVHDLKHDSFVTHEDKDMVVAILPSATTESRAVARNATGRTKQEDSFHLNLLRRLLKSRSSPVPNLFAVHRADDKVSGLFLCATNNDARNVMRRAWASAGKTYTCVCEGLLSPPTGCIRTSIATNSTASGDSVAVSNYHTLETTRIGNTSISLVEVTLDSDYKDQIRMQLASIGHPLLGEDRFRRGDNASAQVNLLRRLALHFSRARVMHPTQRHWLSLEAPVPREFEMLFRRDRAPPPEEGELPALAPAPGRGMGRSPGEEDEGDSSNSRAVKVMAVGDFLRTGSSQRPAPGPRQRR